jgi:hypothetical protein
VAKKMDKNLSFMFKCPQKINRFIFRNP